MKISSSKNRTIDCEVCNLAKMIRKKKPRKRTRSQAKEDEVVAVDTVGPINWSRKGHRYVLFISNRGWVTPYFLKKKSDAYGKIKEYFAEVDRQHGIDFIRTFRGDNEFDIATLQNFFKEHGIKTEFTVPHNPFQNGRAERFHRSVMDMARAMLIDAKLPNSFWEHAVRYAVYIRNRLSSRSDEQGRSGYERKYNKKPDVSNIRTFGEVCYYRVPKPKWKISQRGRKARFLAMDEERKGYTLWDPNDRKIIHSRDVNFIKGSSLDQNGADPKITSETDDPADEVSARKFENGNHAEPELRRSKRIREINKRNRICA